MINTLKSRHNALPTYPLKNQMNDKNTFCQITAELFLADLDRWLVEKIAAVPVDRGAKPPDVYYDRGKLAILREVHQLVLDTKANESCI